MAKYGPTEVAQNNPRRVYLKSIRKWVAVGGPVEITRKPPKKNQTVREATPEEYKHLFEVRKMVTLVQVLENDTATETSRTPAQVDADAAKAQAKADKATSKAKAKADAAADAGNTSN